MCKHESKDWLTADKQGLAQLVEKRGKSFVIGELVQNAWDEEGVTEVNIWLEPLAGRPHARLSIEDNAPGGWANMGDSYTLFAPSKKKGDPTKRGRFNLGEKLVLALCTEASIISMDAAMVFDNNGRRASKKRRKVGTSFEAVIRMTREEFSEVEEFVQYLLPPEGIVTTFNGDDLIARSPVATFFTTLPTEFEDDEGNLRPTRRQTEVQVLEAVGDEQPMLFEMGIPVGRVSDSVLRDDKWHVNVLQKVPVNMSRNNVSPSYLQKVRTAVLNHMIRDLEDAETSEAWVQAATEDPDVADVAVEQYMDKRFGKKRVAYDPSDREANNIAVAKGYTVVHGNTMSSAQWKNAKRAGSILPAGQVTPSPKVTFSSTGKDVTIPREKWTLGMIGVAVLAEKLGERLMGVSVSVSMLNDPRGFGACYARGGDLSFNVRRLGKAWFNRRGEKTLDLIIHEFGHEYSENHLSSEYHKALTMLGAKLAYVVHTEPEILEGLF